MSTFPCLNIMLFLYVHTSHTIAIHNPFQTRFCFPFKFIQKVEMLIVNTKLTMLQCVNIDPLHIHHTIFFCLQFKSITFKFRISFYCEFCSITIICALNKCSSQSDIDPYSLRVLQDQYNLLNNKSSLRCRLYE